jgi:starch phosphorylase
MKASIEAVGRRYNSHRMLIEYAERSYFPALRNYERYAGDGCDRARRVAAYLDRLRGQWDQVRITSVSAPAKAVLKAGETLQVRVKVRLGSLEATEVGVQLYHGRIASTGELEQARWVDMSPGERGGDGEVEYAAEVVCAETGRVGYTARLLPSHTDLVDARHYGLLRWA